MICWRSWDDLRFGSRGFPFSLNVSMPLTPLLMI